jgi:transcriptional regulator NrdR family protein
MWCPECEGEARTIDSRKYRDVSQTFDFVRRSRICRVCSHKFVTIEVTQPIWESYYLAEQTLQETSE